MSFKSTITRWFLLPVICQGVLTQLPPPKNVVVKSYNLNGVLHWSPTTESQTVQYTVEYHNEALTKWTVVQGCEATNATHCNFSSIAHPAITLTLRVRARDANRTSSWSQSEPFRPSTQTHLGPPEVNLTQRPNSLIVQIRDPVPQLREQYGRALTYRVLYWDDAKEPKDLKEHDELNTVVTLESLNAGVKYCVRVQYLLRDKIRPGDVSSLPVCAIVPESEDARAAWVVLVGVLVVLLIGGLMIGCMVAIYKNYHKLKEIQCPPISLPVHIREFFEWEEFTQLQQTTPEETVVVIVEEEEEEEEEEEKEEKEKEEAYPYFPEYGKSLE